MLSRRAYPNAYRLAAYPQSLPRPNANPQEPARPLTLRVLLPARDALAVARVGVAFQVAPCAAPLATIGAGHLQGGEGGGGRGEYMEITRRLGRKPPLRDESLGSYAGSVGL